MLPRAVLHDITAEILKNLMGYDRPCEGHSSELFEVCEDKQKSMPAVAFNKWAATALRESGSVEGADLSPDAVEKVCTLLVSFKASYGNTKRVQIAGRRWIALKTA